MLLGKEIKGKPVPMAELNLKMGTAVVEGKVFAAECYETTAARHVDADLRHDGLPELRHRA